VYADGRVFVSVTSTPEGAAWPGPRLGWGMIFDGRRGFTCVLPQSGLGASDAIPFALATAGSSGNVLWSPADASGSLFQAQLSAIDGRRSAVLVGDATATGTVRAAHRLRFWPPTIDDAATAEALTAEYIRPANLMLDAGTLRRDARGDLNGDGFNESEGCYELAARREELRFLLDPGMLIRPDPILRISDTRSRNATVTIDDQLASGVRTGRDGHGDLLLMLPTVSQQPVRVGVALQKK
jgi:hypothetical protein